MTVRKRGKGFWVDFSFNKLRYSKKSPDNSFHGAKAYELLLRQKLARGEPLDENKVEIRYTFKVLAWQWCDVYVKNNNKQSEIGNKQSILKSSLIPYFGNKYIEQINSYDVEKFKNYLLNDYELSPKSINNRLSTLSRCLKSAIEWEMMSKMPIIKLLKVPQQKFDFLTTKESEILINASNGNWSNMILLALQSGLRFGEIIALRWEDINFDEEILTVNKNIVRGVEVSPKSNKIRVVPLTSKVINMLKEREKSCEYIFHDENNNPLKYGNCLRHLHKICKETGLRQVGWHILRHSFASNLASKNNSIVAIKELLGHSDIRTTMRYSHINIPILKKVIATME